MSNTHKILRNLTASDIFINDTGRNILASSDYIIPDRDFLLWSESEDVQEKIDLSELVVVVGSTQLSMAQSKIDIRMMPEENLSNIDGGTWTSIYGGTNPIDGGSF